MSTRRRARLGIEDNTVRPVAFSEACPQLELAEDPEQRAPHVSTAHRCAARAGLAPTAVHQLVFCLSEQYAGCPQFADVPARTPVEGDTARPRRANWPLVWAAAGALAAGIALGIIGGIALDPLGGREASRAVAAGDFAVTPAAAASTPVASLVRSDPPIEAMPATGATPASANDGAEQELFAKALAGVRPARVEPSAPEVRRYLVQPGDSLLAIALAHAVELDVLLAANDLRLDDPIIAGQELLLPPTALPLAD